MEFFENDAAKASAWLKSVNLLLGNITPLKLLEERPGKLLKFVTARLSENKR